MSGEEGSTSSRQGTGKTDVLIFGPFRFDPAEGVLHRNGTEVAVPPKALAVLDHLLQSPQLIVSKQDLLSAVWNGMTVTDHSLTEAVRILRQGLEDDPQQPKYVETVHGRGYRFIGEVRGGSGDARPESGEAPAAPGGERGRPAAGGSPVLGRARMWTLGTVAFAAIALVVVWQSRQNVAPNSLTAMRFSLSAPTGWKVLAGRSGPDLAVSPDGTTLAYAATGYVNVLYLVSADDLEIRRVPLSENRSVHRMFFSPDGRRMGFFSLQGLEVMSLDGEEIETICRECGSDGTTSRAGAGATWGTDGTIVFANGKLFQIPAAGGTPRPVPTPDPYRAADYLWPSLLPDGSSVLVTIAQGETIHDARIAVVSLETGQTRIVIENGTSARYMSTGHIVFGRDGNLLAVPFDLDRLEVSGEPVVVVPGVMMNPINGATQFSVSDEGTLFYQPGTLVGIEQARLVASDRDGNIRIVSRELRDYSHLAYSPDGRWLTATITARGRSIWLYDVSRRTWDQLAEGEADDDDAVWSPDSSQVAFASNRGGVHGVYVMPIDRSRPPERIMTAEHGLKPTSWSPDGILAVTANPAAREYEVWMVAIDGSAEPELFGPGTSAQFSPNGRWLAYYDDHLLDEPNFFIAPYPGTGERLRVSDDWNIYRPQWSPDGRSMYFYSSVNLYVVAVETEPELWVGEPKELPFGSLEYAMSSEPEYEAWTGSRELPVGSIWYAVAPGGEEVVFAERVRPKIPQTTHLNVVRNWFEELQRLVPAER